MKKIFITLAVLLTMGATALAQTQTTKVVTDSVAFYAKDVKVYQGSTKNGTPKYWIELPTESGVRKVTISQNHIASGRKLALIERRDEESGKYSYSVKYAEPKASNSGARADLSGLK